jgi:carbamoyl-phosphate synthase small subunit
MTDAIAVTADGAVFRGQSVGADGITTGEAVFNTSMSGYQEIFSDPSYAGQVVVMTSSHIGNYGTTPGDDQSRRPFASGVVMRSMSRRHSNWRAEGSLGEYLRHHGLVALADLDTRRLTRHIRDHGAQPIAMGSGATEQELREAAASAPSMVGRPLALEVSVDKAYSVPTDGHTVGRVVALDLGMKTDIISHFSRLRYDVTVLPAGSTAEEVLAHDPTGVFISNGPGDPEPLSGPIAAIQGVLGKVPLFGICLGHQVLGIALGGATFKLPFGHHGGNHPVRSLADGRVAITAQNHGFAVDPWSFSAEAVAAGAGGSLPWDVALPAGFPTPFGTAIPTHQNLNDGTLEGLRCLDIPAFSVQYHPEAAPGPRDALGLFDDFVQLMTAHS